MSETAAKFDMSKTFPTTHDAQRERQSTREGTGEMGSVTGTAEFMVHEPSTKYITPSTRKSLAVSHTTHNNPESQDCLL